MSTLSSRLLLKRPAGPDQFLRQDFVDNYNLLDAKPGLHICTSATRPTGWTVAQLGMAIYETDTGVIYHWVNPGWMPTQGATPAWRGSLVVSATLSANAVANYNDIITAVPIRGCSLYVTGTVKIGVPNDETQDATITPRADGADIDFGPADLFRQTNTGQPGGLVRFLSLPFTGAMPGISAGSHSIGLRVSVGGSAGTIQIGGIRMFAFMVNVDGGL